jgi:hypothetical protein
MRFSPPHPSSHFRRLAAPALLGFSMLGGVLAPAPAAHADVSWCWGDPVVSINGQQTQIVVGLDGSLAQVQASGIVANITVTVPAGVITRIVVPPVTIPFLETLTIVTTTGPVGIGPIPVKVSTTFTVTSPGLATSVMNTVMQVTQPNSTVQTVYGTTRKAVAVSFLQ